MAEERIICLHIGSHLRTCPLMKNSGYCILDCGCDQLEGIKCNKGLPRTEAIERMAVAMCLKCNRTDTCENCLFASNGDCDLKSYYPLAEAALDALIKGE